MRALQSKRRVWATRASHLLWNSDLVLLPHQQLSHKNVRTASKPNSSPTTQDCNSGIQPSSVQLFQKGQSGEAAPKALNFLARKLTSCCVISANFTVALELETVPFTCKTYSSRSLTIASMFNLGTYWFIYIAVGNLPMCPIVSVLVSHIMVPLTVCRIFGNSFYMFQRTICARAFLHTPIILLLQPSEDPIRASLTDTP